VGPDGFTVDLDALVAARDRVGRLAAELINPPDVPRAEAFGHDRLAEAVDEFSARGQRRLAWLANEAASIQHRLDETLKAYRKMDRDNAGWFGGTAS
jgi:hypothetical protein